MGRTIYRDVFGYPGSLSTVVIITGYHYIFLIGSLAKLVIEFESSIGGSVGNAYRCLRSAHLNISKGVTPNDNFKRI